MRVIEDICSNGHGPLSPSYLFIHETATPGAPAVNFRNAARRGTWEYVTQYVCDWTGDVYHLMPDDRLAWAVGNGNRYGVNLEICHATNQEDFDKAWDTAVEFSAQWLKGRGWGVDHMMSHDECRRKWGGTTHVDPDGYFAKYGRTWAEFKSEVAARIAGTAKTKEDDLKAISIPNGTYEVHRLYNPSTSDHMFTSSAAERDSLVRAGWKSEGVAWKGADTGRVVYRLYNPNNGDHMFTADFNEAASLQKAGWSYEGANFASARGGKPVYRVYNPNTSDHMFTASDSERKMLVKAGWKDEGTAFYAA